MSSHDRFPVKPTGSHGQFSFRAADESRSPGRTTRLPMMKAPYRDPAFLSISLQTIPASGTPKKSARTVPFGFLRWGHG